MNQLKVKRLTDILGFPDLAYATPGSSGLDLHAALTRAQLLEVGQQYMVPCGFAVEIPEGYEGQVRSRSGLSAKQGIRLKNGIGTIDSDYRGEIFALLENAGDAAFWIMPHAKIAQLVIVPIAQVVPVEVSELDPSQRGENGFGSTGNGGAVVDETTPAADVNGDAAKQALADQQAADAAAAAKEAQAKEDAEREAAAARQAEEDRKALEAKDAFVTLYDTVNKVLFMGHPSKVTDTVVEVTADQAEVYIADGATDRRVQ